MDETSNSPKQKTFEKNINEINNKIKKIKNSFYCKCIFNCVSYCRNKRKSFLTKCSIMTQFLFTLVPLAHIISLLLAYTHIYFFDRVFQDDYYTAIKKEYLRYLITDIDDIHFQISQNYINSQFEDISNLLFFKLYFGELISLGLLGEDTKIFPNISNITEEIYQYIDMTLIEEGANNIFGIPTDLSRQYIDERNDSFSELMKIYFYFEPLISYEAYLSKTYINQTFLIAYKMKDNKDVDGEELYFNFPTKINEYSSNFYPYNNLISPKINKTEPEQLKLLNDSFYWENWFINQDYGFRTIAHENFDLLMNFLHLNDNHEGNINKTTIVSMQSFFKNKQNEKFIINIIYFISQKQFNLDDFDHSLFILLNDSSLYLTKKRFSDNQTFLISQYDITEMSLSSLVSEYFHYGLTSNNYNFYSKGVFYDNIDINQFSEPSDYYSTIKGFNLDIRYFSPFYLYAKLFQRISYIKNYSEKEYLYTYSFNDTKKIKGICEKYNFSLYRNHLTSNNINCLDKNNLYYYTNDSSNDTNTNEVNLPFCICLPLYCIKNLEQNYNNNIIEYADNITLPEKCQNNLQFYDNQIEESNIKKEKVIDISNINLKLGNSENQLEDQLIKFSYHKFDLIGGLNVLLISIVDNKSLRIILTGFFDEMKKIRFYFLVIVIVGISLLFIGAYILVLINLYKISKIIYQYKKKLNNYTIQMQNKITNITNKNVDLNNATNTFFSIDKNNCENSSLIQNEKYDKFNNEDNSLINELFSLYCMFYKLSEENIINNYEKNKERNKKLMKIKIMSNNNELFNLFCIMSTYIPKFKLDINFDFDFYKDSKLMNNFLKILSKRTTLNIDDNQIIYTKSIIYELLSTESINDYGFITNLNFNYLTDINLKTKKGNNPIQIALFKQIKYKKSEDTDEDKDYSSIKLIWKSKNLIMKSIEEKFEQDDYLNLDKLKSAFNSSIINNYYNYLSRILSD